MSKAAKLPNILTNAVCEVIEEWVLIPRILMKKSNFQNANWLKRLIKTPTPKSWQLSFFNPTIFKENIFRLRVTAIKQKHLVPSSFAFHVALVVLVDFKLAQLIFRLLIFHLVLNSIMKKKWKSNWLYKTAAKRPRVFTLLSGLSKPPYRFVVSRNGAT